MPGSDLLEPCNDGDVYVKLGIQFLSSTEYNHLFYAHDLCGTRSTWLCLFLLSLSSSETATLKTFHAAPHIGLETSRPSGGELPRWVLLSRPESRSDLIDGFEPSSGCETIYWDSLPVFFYNRIKISYTYQKNYHRSGVRQNLYIYTESHLHIQNCTYTFTNQSVGHTVMNPY